LYVYVNIAYIRVNTSRKNEIVYIVDLREGIASH
jgi:hypothetical protein